MSVMSLRITPAFQSTAANEFRQEALEVTALASLAGGIAFIVTTEWARWPLDASIAGFVLVMAGLISLMLAGRYCRIGVWLLAGGMAAACLVIFRWQPLGSVACLMALPLGFVACLLGLGSGILSAVALSAVVLLLLRPLLGGAALASVVAAIWGTLGLSWIATRPTLQAFRWAWRSYEHAWDLLEDARAQRVELKQTQADLVEANRELARLSDRLNVLYQAAENARRAKEEFVAHVSHELRTPLNMVIGFSEMITQSPEFYGGLPPMLLADISAIQRNAQHLSNLVDDILDLSQLDADRMALNREPASLRAIIAGAMDAVHTFFESKGLYLEADVPESLPVVMCDPVRIGQVVLNLLSNAGRFTERGGVRVRARQEERRIIVSVSDTGPGISPETQMRIFEPFQQLDNSIRRRYGGSGLGLSISKRLVEQHGGEMWLQSAVGEGTTFYFSLPITLLESIASAGDVKRWFSPYHQYDARAQRSRAPAPDLKPRFLVLESGRTLQGLLSRYTDGVDWVPVNNTEDALRELERSPVQALIVNTPWMRHLPAELRDLARTPYETPTVFCCVPGREDIARDLGAVAQLTKPVQREILLGHLAALGDDVRTVLVVDDDPEALQLLTRMLASARRNYRVLRATNGEEALRLMRTRRPDAVVLDLIMPGMDGFAVLNEKRQDATLRSIPVIVASAHEVMGEVVLGNAFMVAKGDLSVRGLAACAGAISHALSPQQPGPGSRGTPGELWACE